MASATWNFSSSLLAPSFHCLGSGVWKRTRIAGQEEWGEKTREIPLKQKQKSGRSTVKSHDNFVWELDMVLNLVD